MAAITFTDEFTSSIPAPKLFKAFILDADNLLPTVVPQVIKNIKTLEGDGGAGTIKQLNFAEGNHSKYVKHRIDAIDKENMTYRYTLIDGDAFMDKIESVSYELKFETSPNGGSNGKNISTYRPRAGAEISQEEIKAGRERAASIYKAVEAYLLANPDAYA